MSKCYYPLTAQSVEELAAIFDDFLRGAWAPLVEGGITADNLSPTLFSPALGGGPTGGTGGAGLVPVQGSEGSKYVLGIPILHRDAPGSIRQKFYQGKPAGIEFLIDSSVGDDGRICLVDYKDASKLQILSLAMSGSDGQVVANTGDLLLDATTGDVLINGVSIGDYARKSQNETITGDWTHTGGVVMTDATHLAIPASAPVSLDIGDIYWDKLGDGRIHFGGLGPVDTKVWDDGGVNKMDLSGVTGGVFLPDYNGGVGDNEIGYDTGGGQLRWKYGGVAHVGWDNNNFDPTDYLTIVAAAAAYQPLDGDLTSWALVSRASGFDTFTATPSGANLAALLTTALPASKGGTGLTSLAANVVSILSAADYAAIRTLLSLVPNTDIQPYDDDLTKLADNNQLPTLTKIGGTSSAFPAIKRSLATLQIRLADDSALADLVAANIHGDTLYEGGVALSSLYQPLDSDLTALAALTTTATGRKFLEVATPAANSVMVVQSDGTIVASAATSFGLSLLDDATQAAARTTLGLTPGTDVQAYDAELTALAGLTSAADKLPYFTGSGTAGLATFTAAARTFTALAAAQGEIPYSSAADTWARLSPPAANTNTPSHVLTHPGGSSAANPAWKTYVRKVKTGSDDTVNNSTDLTSTSNNDDTLTTNLESGKTYAFVFTLFVNVASTDDYKFRVFSPGSSSFRINTRWEPNGAGNPTLTNSSTDPYDQTIDLGVTAEVHIQIFGFVTTSSAGSFGIRHAKRATGAQTITVRSGSQMEVWETP